MKGYGRRRAPWVLMGIGALMALCALIMLGQTRGVLQYCVTAPLPDETGSSVKRLVEAQQTVCESIRDSLMADTIGGTVESITLSAGEVSETATMYAMGEGWLEVYPRALVQGRRISETELKAGAHVAMLDESLAFKLFGSELPENAAIQLGGKDYQVVGTVRHGEIPLGYDGRGVGDIEAYDFYVPLNAIAADGVQMDVMTVSILPQAQSGTARLFEDVMQNQWQDGGTLIDLSKEAMRRTILPRMIVLVVGLYVLVGLFRRMTALAGDWFGRFRSALSMSYFKSLIPRLLGIILLSVLGYAVLIGAAWALMAFSVQPLYVFTEWVPENIVEWSSIQKVFWNLTGDAAQLVKIGSRELRTVEFWGGILRWGMIALLLGAAMRRARPKKE